MSRPSRLQRHAALSTELARLSDARLAMLLANAPAATASIGGATTTLDVAGARVFVKRIPLSDLERRFEHSTANLFAMPTWCHYGIGSPGFGVWRELAVHRMTTDWVLSGACHGFPMLHHARVVPCACADVDAATARAIDDAVAFWDGALAVRARLDGIAHASAEVVLFIEYVPHTLDRWFHADAAPWVDRELRDITGFMGAEGLVHFDAHLGNVLTDGEQLFLTDFGLALSDTFDLTDDERAFLARHRSYDRALTATVFDNAAKAVGVSTPYAEVATTLKRFNRALLDDTKATPYPADAIEAALAVASRGEIGRSPNRV